MIDIYKLIYDTLDELGYLVREQGTYAEDEKLLDTLVTYFINDQDPKGFADNKPTGMTTRIQVALYSRDPAIVQQANQLLKGVMLPAGFLRAGGRPIPFDKRSGHYGYISFFNFYELEG